MSIFVRRVQRNIEKLEEKLAYAHRRLEREIERDVERAAIKAQRAEAKAALAAEKRAARAEAKAARDATKGDRAAEKRAARHANPRRVALETFNVLMILCLEDNLRCTMETVNAYMEWKKTVEFPPRANLYQKCERFLRNTILKETAEVPIYAKTMTGELIPLLYHPHHDSRDLLIQLEKIDPEEFPIGSTTLTRLCEDATTPVMEGDIYALFRHNAQMVSYQAYRQDNVEFIPSDDHVVIRYDLKVRADAFGYDPNLADIDDTYFALYYSPEHQTVSVHRERNYRPLHEIRDVLREQPLYESRTGNVYRVSDRAQEEIIAVFEAIRRDR